MTTPEAITREETRGSARLWFGMVGGPIAWAVQLGADWFLVEVVACAPATGSTGVIGGLSANLLLALLNAVLLAVAAIAGLVSRRSLRFLTRTGDSTTGQRALWMARGGVINSLVFGMLIAASYAALVLTRGCSS